MHSARLCLIMKVKVSQGIKEFFVKDELENAWNWQQRCIEQGS